MKSPPGAWRWEVRLPGFQPVSNRNLDHLSSSQDLGELPSVCQEMVTGPLRVRWTWRTKRGPGESATGLPCTPVAIPPVLDIWEGITWRTALDCKSAVSGLFTRGVTWNAFLVLVFQQSGPLRQGLRCHRCCSGCQASGDWPQKWQIQGKAQTPSRPSVCPCWPCGRNLDATGGELGVPFPSGECGRFDGLKTQRLLPAEHEKGCLYSDQSGEFEGQVLRNPLKHCFHASVDCFNEQYFLIIRVILVHYQKFGEICLISHLTTQKRGLNILACVFAVFKACCGEPG